MPRPRYRRTSDGIAPVEVPAVLPLVVMTVDADGSMTVAVDGTPFLPAPFAPAWVRGSFAMILDQLTTQHPTPLRVEVREADGSTFTDIITPTKSRRPATEPEPEPGAHAPSPAPAPPELVVLHGDGFAPGEDVAIAIIIAHSDAAPDGTARGLLTPAQLAVSPTREVILLGRISGTPTIGHPA
ncbi:hypothetical protein [Microbacterium schleiferi]|nr:hypothetical protein [Microbacterium schleiferi]